MAANQNKKSSTMRKAEIGTGIAAAAAAAALGAYLLYGSKNASKNRAKVKGWALKAKGEILEQVENLENVTEETYQDVVNKVIASYRGAKNVTGPELMALAADARKHWKALSPLLKKGKRGNVGAKPKKGKASTKKTAKKGSSSKKS